MGSLGILGNIIWVVFGGLFIFLHYLLSSLFLFITIIGIPFGLQTLKLSQMALWPFGREIHTKPNGSGCLSLFMNILWFFFGGIWLALHHLFWTVIFAITIIGMPFALQHLKLAQLALFPFGKEIRLIQKPMDK
jgi:uncharacterized membrane protein YccF (DUF307 family)